MLINEYVIEQNTSKIDSFPIDPHEEQTFKDVERVINFTVYL